MPPKHAYHTSTATLPSPPAPSALAPSTPRTNASLNLAVLRRHWPSTLGILSIAPFAAVYAFSPTSQSWEKTGVEGTLFVVRQCPEPWERADAYETAGGVAGGGPERYAVVVLNRRGLANFEVPLVSEDDVEEAAEFVIVSGADEVGQPAIFGLWIFSDAQGVDVRGINASVIRECAGLAEASRRRAEELQRGAVGDGWDRSGQTAFGLDGAAMGGQGSIGGGDVLGDLFARARMGYQGVR